MSLKDPDHGPLKPSDLANYIIRWLRHRNNDELGEAFNNMRLGDFGRLYDELELILQHQGKPPNWV